MRLLSYHLSNLSLIALEAMRLLYKLSISLDWKISVLKNSTKFARLNTSEIIQNALIVKICEKTLKSPKHKRKETNYLKNDKFLLKRLQTLHIF